MCAWMCNNLFPVWLPNRLLSAGLEPVLSQSVKLCIASNNRQISAHRGYDFYINICRKLSIIRCDKYILYLLKVC